MRVNNKAGVGVQTFDLFGSVMLIFLLAWRARQPWQDPIISGVAELEDRYEHDADGECRFCAKMKASPIGLLVPH